MSTPPHPFRVHFADGEKIDVQAKDANAARRQAESARGGLITKIKRIKQPARAD